MITAQKPTEATIIHDLRKIAGLKKAGIIKTFAPFHYIDEGRENMESRFYFNGKIYALRYYDGCFYPFLHVLNCKILGVNKIKAEIEFVNSDCTPYNTFIPNYSK